MSEISVDDVVQVGQSSTTATVIDLLNHEDAAGDAYVMAILRGARGRIFREETTRLTRLAVRPAQPE